MNKKRVGTLTFHRANNYGAVLQSYALQQHLLSKNVDCKIIDYDMSSIKKLNKIQLIINRLKKYLLFIYNHNEYVRSSKFNQFRKKYLSVTSKTIYDENELNNVKNEFDTIVVGSDQIWNSDITLNSTSFYLDFAKNKRKVSYAASYGRNFIKENEIQYAKKYLNDFDAISVREKSMVTNLNKIIDKQIYHVLDPVFLLNKEDWNKLVVNTDDSDYVLVYSMENSELMIKTLKEIREKFNKRIIIINGGEPNDYSNFGEQKTICGPQDFLTLINNASYVVTNSFHGLAFSIILQKKVICVKHTSRNDRLYNLLESIECKDKQIDYEEKTNQLTDTIIDGSVKYKKLNSTIETSKEFINNYIVKE